MSRCGTRPVTGRDRKVRGIFCWNCALREPRWLKQLFRKAVGFDATEADSPEENNALDRTGHEGHSPDAILGGTKRSIRAQRIYGGLRPTHVGSSPRAFYPDAMFACRPKLAQHPLTGCYLTLGVSLLRSGLIFFCSLACNTAKDRGDRNGRCAAGFGHGP